MGGKGRIAKYILPIILKDRKPEQWYVEPFCGGCNSLNMVEGLRIASDIHYELIEYFKSLLNGWLPPMYINEDDYKFIKQYGTPALKAYVGFSLSFGGKYFGSQARESAGVKGAYDSLRKINHTAYTNAIKQQKLLAGVNFFCGSYDKVKIPPRSVIYCDPPYNGVESYTQGSFNHNLTILLRAASNLSTL